MTDVDIVHRMGAAGPAFFGSFRRLRAVQREAAEPIQAGRDTLITSATASGKTEAVLAPLVARLLAQDVTRTGVVRLLVVAPTRALVNDLAARIDGPLTRLGLSCGRQTSDHRDKARRPFALITTPESFDSMLVRDGVVVDGRLAGAFARRGARSLHRRSASVRRYGARRSALLVAGPTAPPTGLRVRR